MVSACELVLARNSLASDDVSWIVPHQANANLLKQLARGLGLTDSSKIVSVIEHTGNTSSASMGIALDNLWRSGKLLSGDYVLMPAFAAGFTWGAALCRVI
jgi:3-oxoacyl-[acyl-carrier-protein] synthase-3